MKERIWPILNGKFHRLFLLAKLDGERLTEKRGDWQPIPSTKIFPIGAGALVKGAQNEWAKMMESRIELMSNLQPLKDNGIL